MTCAGCKWQFSKSAQRPCKGCHRQEGPLFMDKYEAKKNDKKGH